MSPTGAPPEEQRSPWVRMAIDYVGPAAFLVTYLATKNILAGTFALVAVSALALVAGFLLERRVAFLPLLWGFAALVFGVLTLVFKDPHIIKMKTTFIDAALGVFLLGGLALGKSPIRLLVGGSIRLSDAGWRKLTLRFGLFFFALAALNEVVWRTMAEQVWVVFRFPGLLILSLLFSFTQLPMMLKDAKALEAAVKLAEPQE